MGRLFTAVELTAATRGALVAAQSDLARSLGEVTRSRLRLVGEPQLHLTLAFIGEVEESRVVAISDAMSLELPLPAFEIEFGTCGVFPPRGPARVLWIGVTRGARELTELFDLVSARLDAVGVRRERRPFAPHLTIGRWRDDERGAVRSVLPDLGRVAVEPVSAITLFRSRLLPGGAEHTPVTRTRLGDRARPQG